MPKILGSEFLGKETAGLPNWAWIVVLAAGLGSAYLLPKLFGNKASPASSTDPSTSNGSIGLAIDPTTGLPYAVQGLVPSGVPVAPNPPPPPPAPPTPVPSSPPCLEIALRKCPPGQTLVQGTDANGCPTATCSGTPTAPPTPPATAKYVTATKWPSPLGTLSGIASQYGLTLQAIEALNPQITNPDLIYAGEQIRIA